MTTAYNDGYDQIRMHANLFGIADARAYFHAEQSTCTSVTSALATR
jgi:hypothetical protein